MGAHLRSIRGSTVQSGADTSGRRQRVRRANSDTGQGRVSNAGRIQVRRITRSDCGNDDAEQAVRVDDCDVGCGVVRSSGVKRGSVGGRRQRVSCRRELFRVANTSGEASAGGYSRNPLRCDRVPVSGDGRVRARRQLGLRSCPWLSHPQPGPTRGSHTRSVQSTQLRLRGPSLPTSRCVPTAPGRMLPSRRNLHNYAAPSPQSRSLSARYSLTRRPSTSPSWARSLKTARRKPAYSSPSRKAVIHFAFGWW